MNKTPFQYKHMRKKKYLDRSLQGWMIGLMLAFQLLFLVAGLSFYYIEFTQLIEHYLYSIHGLDIAVFSYQMKMLSGKIILIYLVSNFAFLIIFHFLWVSYITKVLAEFNHLTEKSKKLDFSSDNENSSHLVNEVAKLWRTQQRGKWLWISEQFEKIPHDEGDLAEQKQQLLVLLKSIRKIV